MTEVPSRMLRKPEVLELVGVSHTQLYRMMDAGDFPRPLRISRHIVGWPLATVIAWRESLIESTNQQGKRPKRVAS